jgi:copper chaperone for superoxide dismutase
VRILGSTTAKDLTVPALAESGRKARLVGQGLPESESLLMVLTYSLLNLLQGGICTSNVSMKN